MVKRYWHKNNWMRKETTKMDRNDWKTEIIIRLIDIDYVQRKLEIRRDIVCNEDIWKIMEIALKIYWNIVVLWYWNVQRMSEYKRPFQISTENGKKENRNTWSRVNTHFKLDTIETFEVSGRISGCGNKKRKL